jgi:hypothetical protein
MHLVLHRAVVPLLSGLAFFILSSQISAQEVSGPAQPAVTASSPPSSTLPDAPVAQIEVASIEVQSPQEQNPQQPSSNAAQSQTGESATAPQQNQAPGPPVSTSTGGVQNSATQNGSSSQSSAQQPGTQETQHQKAEEEVREQEHQRIAGIVPSFNVTYHSDAVSLTPAEKFRLEFHAAIDPYTFAISGIVAGLGEAEDTNNGFGWGPGGYAKRAIAAYADNVIGNTLGNALLPSILHQDPRYFRLGHGSIHHRFFYAVATSFICKHDNTGKWEPNYSNVGGNILAGEISNLYYPTNKNDAVQAIETGLTVTFEGTFGATLQEFWPDLSRRFFHKDPTHGLDAQAQAADAAAKQKKQQEQNHQD